MFWNAMQVHFSHHALHIFINMYTHTYVWQSFWMWSKKNCSVIEIFPLSFFILYIHLFIGCSTQHNIFNVGRSHVMMMMITMTMTMCDQKSNINFIKIPAQTHVSVHKRVAQLSNGSLCYGKPYVVSTMLCKHFWTAWNSSFMIFNNLLSLFIYKCMHVTSFISFSILKIYTNNTCTHKRRYFWTPSLFMTKQNSSSRKLTLFMAAYGF